ncbi:Hemicentin-2 [Halotydeus destructor]|nr:Hemicentin-2 [Halotydeus destructor]
MAKNVLWLVLSTVMCFLVHAQEIPVLQNARHRRVALEAPEIGKQISYLESREESKIAFMCSLSKGSSPVEFSWTKDGSPLETHVKVKNDLDVSTTTVIIDQLQPSDSGNYTCKARNSAGQDSHTLQLVVKQTPKWLKEPDDVLTALGLDVTVECTANGFPTPVTTWFKLDHPNKKLSQGNYLLLNKISNEADGLYECVADNGVDKALRKTIRISVNAFREIPLSVKSRRAATEPPEIIKQLNELKLEENAKFVLTCSLSKGTSPVKFSWLKNGQPLTGDDVKIRSQEEFSMTTLMIHVLKSSDAGNYTCQAANSAGQDSHSLMLSIKQTAKWTKQPQDLVAAVGEDVSIECSASGFPVPTISWFRLTEPTKQKVFAGNYLRLDRIQSESAGLYECLAENGVNEVLKKTIRISVNVLLVFLTVYEFESSSARKIVPKVRRALNEAPEITKLLSNLELSQNEKFSFFCSLRKGSAPVAFSWFKDGTSLTNVDAKIKNIEEMSMLTIEKLKASDAGNYTCTAQNSVGHDSISLSLIVKQTPKWIVEPTDIIAHVGREISLECSASGSPTPLISWFRVMEHRKLELFKGNQMKLIPVTEEDMGTYECVADNGVDEPLRKSIRLAGSSPVEFTWIKDGTSLTISTAKITDSQDMSILTIEKLTASDAGNYTCKAQNSAGQDSIMVELNVKQTPKWIKEPADTNAIIGEEIVVDCSASGSPVPTLVWYKLNEHGKQELHRGNQLRISQVNRRVEGLYECAVENGNDATLRKSFKITVNETLKWLKEPNDVVATAGQDISVECSATGSPTAVMTWFRIGQLRQKLSHGNYLKLNDIRSEAAGLYECNAENGVDDVLKKTIRVSITGRKLFYCCVWGLKKLEHGAFGSVRCFDEMWR